MPADHAHAVERPQVNGHAACGESELCASGVVGVSHAAEFELRDAGELGIDSERAFKCHAPSQNIYRVRKNRLVALLKTSAPFL